MFPVQPDRHLFELVRIGFSAHHQGMVFGIERQLVQLLGLVKRIRDQVSLNRSVVILQSAPNLVALRDRRLFQLAGWEWLGGKEASEEFDVCVVVVELR